MAKMRGMLAILFLAVAAASCAHAETQGKLYGYVVSGTGNPLSSVNVTATGPGYVNFTYSNGEGRYEFPYALPPGTYNVSASCNCRTFGNATETGVVIEAGRETYLNITLNPPSEEGPTPTPEGTATPEGTPTPIACTQEAMICPDGSAVGRVGPNCEFAPCPQANPPPPPAPNACPLGFLLALAAGIAIAWKR